MLGIWELPLSMPRDGSLLFLGYSPDEILKMWIDCAQSIRAAQGIVVLLTHCEARFSGSTEMMRIYRAFIEYLLNEGHYEITLGTKVIAQLGTQEPKL
jgi:hypothetical protein